MDLEKWHAEHHHQVDEEIALAEKHLKDLKAKKMALGVGEHQNSSGPEEHEALLLEEDKEFLTSPERLLELKKEGQAEVHLSIVGIVVTLLLLLSTGGCVYAASASMAVLLWATCALSLFLTFTLTIYSSGAKKLKSAKRVESVLNQQFFHRKLKDALKTAISQGTSKKQMNMSLRSPKAKGN